MGVAPGTGKTDQGTAKAMLEPRSVSIEARAGCSKRGHWKGLICACSLSLACAIDSRPGNIVTETRGNGEAGDQNVLPGSAGSSNALPGDPGGSPLNAAGSSGTNNGDGPNPVVPLNAGGAAGTGVAGSNGSDAAGAAMMMGTGPGASGAAGSGSGDPGETEAIGGCFNQLLANGGFDRGHEGWSELSEAVHDVIVRRDASLLVQAGMTPHDGDYLAWIGGIPNGDFRMFHSTMQQTVAIPAEAVSLTLSGYYWVSQPEPNGANVDWAVLEAEDPDPNVSALWVIERFDKDSDNNSNGWVHFEVTTLDPPLVAAGKTVTIRANSIPDGNGTLSLWLDSLRLEARCPR
jgi:hypothetical protein